MFGLAYRFPAGRYHATPWGRNVNEADVAWPPEPWRILRALVACYWRKCDRERWHEDDLARLIDALADELPVFHLPSGAIHAHTRHYMPVPKDKPKLVFDAFLHLPTGAEVIAIWQDTTLDSELLDLARDLASGMGYLGRAESWTECRVVTTAAREPNCRPVELDCGPVELDSDRDLVRILVPRSPADYTTERQRLIDRESERIRESSKGRLTDRELRGRVAKAWRGKGGADTLPIRLMDAIAVETADLQDRKWDRPPAAYETTYGRNRNARASVMPRSAGQRRTREMSPMPTVARYLLAGRPPPRIEDAVKIGETLRKAAMSKFGWETDSATGKRPRAPWQISGRGGGNHPVRDPTHPHAFWLPEDADGDGWIDHVTVFIASGMTAEIQTALGRVTRIWRSSGRSEDGSGKGPRVDEWRLALEGFGRPEDFAGSGGILGTSRRWRSVTPFLASGHLKKAGYEGEVRRLLNRRGIDAGGVRITEIDEITVGGAPRRALNFHRFRSRGRERQLDSSGTLLELDFRDVIPGPLTLGYGCHFGLGMFEAL